MRWKIHGERAVYSSDWVNVRLIDVELPDGRRFEHHAVRMQPVAAAVVVDDQDRALLMWRHRFITDTWGWEIPTGIVDEGEAPVEAAAREVEEETGWRPGPLTALVAYEPSNGITDSRHHLFRADGATYIGPPTETTESDRVEWVPLSEVRSLLNKGELADGPSLVGLLHVLAFDW
ncbi:MAG: NUDIX hydrolase [Actinomycetota bacterium]|nr:NUDIX hydrolase [Actinomycetota bacterium]